MNSEIESSVVIVNEINDVEETSLPFGKRYGQQLIMLNEEHLAALRAGQYLALDAQGEYVVFVGLQEMTVPSTHSSEVGRSGV